MGRLIKFKDALKEAQHEEMARDPNVFVYGVDVADHKRIFGSTVDLVESFGPSRCFSTPLSEDALAGFGLGAAVNHMRPINVHIRVDFLLLAMNQLANMISSYQFGSAGELKAPIVFRSVIGRGWGQAYQHSKTLHSFFAHLPGLKVILPSTVADAKGLLKSAIRDDNPVVFLEHRWLYEVEGTVPETSDREPIGRCRILREGSDITIVAVSWMNIEALKAAEILERRGVSVEVIDPRTVSPLDIETIVASVSKTRHCLVADYDWVFCGFGAEVTAEVQQRCFGQLNHPVRRLGFQPFPCPTSRPLENAYYPYAKDIVHLVDEMLDQAKTDVSGEEFYSWENRFKGPF